MKVKYYWKALKELKMNMYILSAKKVCLWELEMDVTMKAMVGASDFLTELSQRLPIFSAFFTEIFKWTESTEKYWIFFSAVVCPLVAS